MSKTIKYHVRNPDIVFREEFDDWAILFDPDTGNVFGLNPTGALAWKMLDGTTSVKEIAEAMMRLFSNVPEEAPAEIMQFIDELVERGYVGQDVTTP
ncbi:MAG: SynChlorMet cassette protein ScmD [Methanofollis sp.]|nr:SynChlorMet cassette protein ScmD [Methanofollis sp.]